MVGMGAYVAYDYGTGAATTGSNIIYNSNCGTTATAIEYGYEDCTCTNATGGRVWIPVSRKVRNTGWAVTNATSTCTWPEWEIAEDECGIRWEGYGASQTVYKVVKWTSYGDVMKSYPKMTPEEMAAYEKKQREDRFRQIIQGRCAPNAIVRDSKRQPLAMPTDVREQRARETLRRVIGDAKFVNFMKHGFISVKAKSGLVYQIFTGHGITHVFNQGNLVERLCVVLNGGFPPTDSLIMRYLLILNNESQFRKLAVKHGVSNHKPSAPAACDLRPLSEIFAELRKAG
jgi:hypothetical protein